MKTLDSGDKCPVCGENQMPAWNPLGKETARACQMCGHIEERSTDGLRKARV